MSPERKWRIPPRLASWTRTPDLVKVASWLADNEAYSRARHCYIKDYLDYGSVRAPLSQGELYTHSVTLAQLMERDLPEFIEAFFQYNSVLSKEGTRRALINSISDTIVAVVGS